MIGFKSLLVILLASTAINAWERIGDFPSQEAGAAVQAVAFSSDDSKLFSSNSNGEIQVRSTVDNSLLQVISVGEIVNNILVRNDVFYISTTEGKFMSYNATSYEEIASGSYTGSSSGYAHDIEFTNGGSQIYAVGDNDGDAKIYKYSTSDFSQVGDAIQATGIPGGAIIDQIAVPTDDSGFVISSAFNDEENYTQLVAFGADDLVQTYYESDAGLGNNQKFIEFYQNNTLCVGYNGSNVIQQYDFAPNASETIDQTISFEDGYTVTALNTDFTGNLIVGLTDGANHKAAIYNLKDQGVTDELQHDSQILDIAVSSDKKKFGFGQNEGLDLWAETEDTVEESESFTGTITAVTATVLVGSVGTLAATSAAQGAGGVVAGAAAGGADVGAGTAKNLL